MSILFASTLAAASNAMVVWRLDFAVVSVRKVCDAFRHFVNIVKTRMRHGVCFIRYFYCF